MYIYLYIYILNIFNYVYIYISIFSVYMMSKYMYILRASLIFGQTMSNHTPRMICSVQAWFLVVGVVG